MFEKGLNYDANQCNEKFRSLKHRHKKITDNNEKSGRGRSTWQYYDAMEELLAGDPAVRPIKVVASSTATPAAESTSTGSSATLTQKPPLPPNILRTKTQSPVRSLSPVESVASDEQVTPVIKRRRKMQKVLSGFKTLCCKTKEDWMR
ncbi:uncharacterized protein LOC132736021 [Ruditapes philippinarum]|uniref:uncharacterized protein LOC132736021 n=1 Tax=Ruditapes philippinarum TaxID=129788 RepID=UPI00295B42E1|nr:uncharacterized protein LOC132736021 [Ruditapes philippinarum]